MIDRESMYYVLRAEVERLQHERDEMKRWAEWFIAKANRGNE